LFSCYRLVGKNCFLACEIHVVLDLRCRINTQREMESWTWQEYLVALLTLVLIAAVLLFKFRLEIKLRWKGVFAEGQIVNWMATQESGKRYFYPLISFTSANGREIKFRAEERCEMEPMYPVGTAVRIKYLKDQPDVRVVVYPR
jgi:hypothetical protein